MRVKKTEQDEDFKFLNISLDRYIELFNQVYNGTFKEYRGFAVQKEKAKGQWFFPTKRPSKYNEVEDGKIKSCPLEPMYDNILDAYKEVAKYNGKQVLAGLTHFRRDVMVVDCDRDYTEGTIDYFNSYCDKFDIPRPNLFLINPETNHFQVHWYLSNPYTSPYSSKKNGMVFPQEMHILRHEMNIVLNGDDNFTGGFMKNPFHKSLKCIWNSKDFVNKTALEIGFNKAFRYEFAMSYPEYHDYKLGNKETPKNKQKSVKKVDNLIKTNRSRHQESGKKAIADGFEYMRNHNGNIDADFIRDKIIEHQWEVVREINDPSKTTIEPIAIINRQTQDVINYCKQHYDDKSAKKWNHERGTEIKVLKGKLQAIKINYLKEQGKTSKEIAEIVDMTPQGVNANIRKNKDDIEGCFETIRTFYGQNKNRKDKSNSTMCDLIKEVLDFVGYEFTDEEEIISLTKEEVTVEEAMDALFSLFNSKAIIELPNGRTIFNNKYNIKQKIRPKIA